jgi:hypothetical protein
MFTLGGQLSNGPGHLERTGKSLGLLPVPGCNDTLTEVKTTHSVAPWKHSDSALCLTHAYYAASENMLQHPFSSLHLTAYGTHGTTGNN